MSNPTVTLHTNHGDITLEIFADKVPKTAKNFVELAKKPLPFFDYAFIVLALKL